MSDFEGEWDQISECMAKIFKTLIDAGWTIKPPAKEKVITPELALKWVENNYDKGLYFVGKILESDSPPHPFIYMAEDGNIYLHEEGCLSKKFVTAILAKRPEYDVDNRPKGFSVGRFTRGAANYWWGKRLASDQLFRGIGLNYSTWNGYRYELHKEPELKISGFRYKGEFRVPEIGEYGTIFGKSVGKRGPASSGTKEYFILEKVKEEVVYACEYGNRGQMIFNTHIRKTEVSWHNAVEAEWMRGFKCYRGRTDEGELIDFEDGAEIPYKSCLIGEGCGVVFCK